MEDFQSSEEVRGGKKCLQLVKDVVGVGKYFPAGWGKGVCLVVRPCCGPFPIRVSHVTPTSFLPDHLRGG